MIFIALGTQKFQLNRLLRKIDELVSKGVITDVYAQIGASDYCPKNFTYEKYMDKAEFEDKIKSCDILISHGGVGTILKALEYGKKIIVFPRIKDYGEHVDNHQLEIADAFSDLGYTVTCKKEEELQQTIKSLVDFTPVTYERKPNMIVPMIINFLAELEDE